MNPVVSSSSALLLRSLPSIAQSSTAIKTSLLAKATLPLVVYTAAPPVGVFLVAVCVVFFLAVALSDCEPSRVHYVAHSPSYCSNPCFVGRIPTTRIVFNTPPSYVSGRRHYSIDSAPRDGGSRVPVGGRMDHPRADSSPRDGGSRVPVGQR